MEKDLTKYKILVVDDEEDICEILHYNLTAAGYTVETAANAEEALFKLRDGFHLILLDIMMDGISGLKMAQLLREEYNSNIPIIFLSALDVIFQMTTVPILKVPIPEENTETNWPTNIS